MSLPKVAPGVVAEILDELPQRLRKRVDAALPKASSWTVSDDGCTVVIDADTTLTFRLQDGVLAAAADLACTCLLAPKCLHRAVAVSVAPVGEAVVAPEEPVSLPPAEFSADAVAAAGLLWEAGTQVLHAGVSGSGAVIQASLLRAVHSARIAGLHRASTAALRVVTGVRAAHSGRSDFSRTVLTADLSELLLVCHQIRAGLGDVSELRGTARREYQPIGSLKLHGLFTERIVTDSGYAGVVTHLVDSRGGLWTINAVAPGGPERVPAAFDGPVALGESGLSHRQLSRSGLLLSSATGSADRRLGAGSGVRAVAAPGAPWSTLWEEPLEAQVERAFTSSQQLLFLNGADVASGRVTLIGNTEVAQENLRLLSGMTERLLFIARLIPSQPGAAVALAASGPVKLPGAWGGVVNLTLERLQRAYVDAEPIGLATPAEPSPSPIELLERWLHRITLGGRRIPAITSASTDQARLATLGLVNSAQILATLQTTARDETRDPFGRLVTTTSDDFVLAWLRGCVHAEAFTQSTARTTWLGKADATP